MISREAADVVKFEVDDAIFELESVESNLSSGVLTIPLGAIDHSTSEPVGRTGFSERSHVRLRRTDLRIGGVESVEISEHAGIWTYSFGEVQLDEDQTHLTISSNELGSIRVAVDPAKSSIELVPRDEFIATVERRVWFGVMDGQRLVAWTGATQK